MKQSQGPCPDPWNTCFVFGAGRCVHATGYTRGYGSHGLGFALATISTLAAEGLLTVTALKGCGAF